MNNIQSSSMSKFYLSLYGYAYELEYGCVLIMFIGLTLACHSEGVGPAGVRSCFRLCEHGVQVCGNQWMCGYLSGRGVGGRVVTALSSFAFPHDQVF